MQLGWFGGSRESSAPALEKLLVYKAKVPMYFIAGPGSLMVPT